MKGHRESVVLATKYSRAHVSGRAQRLSPSKVLSEMTHLLDSGTANRFPDSQTSFRLLTESRKKRTAEIICFCRMKFDLHKRSRQRIYTCI